MSKKLFIGNLSWSIDDAKMEEIFSAYGVVTESFVMKDRDSGRSRGFGFVTFESEEAADKAIAELDGTEVDGRNIVVNEAKEKKERY
ncbi:RNA-binding protein [Patescibacteria group bacterium]|nr:RNA-binding protein [Patescibacteria group bacterium]